MGFRFSKRIKILPGVTINLGKGGVSASVGPKGAKLNVGKNGVRGTVGLPGTGMSYSKTIVKKSRAKKEKQSKVTGVIIFVLILAAAFAWKYYFKDLLAGKNANTKKPASEKVETSTQD